MLAVKNVGEPCAGEPHARIDGGREETRAQSAMPCDPGASRLPDHSRWTRRSLEAPLRVGERRRGGRA